MESKEPRWISKNTATHQETWQLKTAARVMVSAALILFALSLGINMFISPLPFWVTKLCETAGLVSVGLVIAQALDIWKRRPWFTRDEIREHQRTFGTTGSNRHQ